MTDRPTVTLATGEVVDNTDPAWMNECLVRHRHVQTLLGMRFLSDRRLYLGNIERSEGAESRRRLEAELAAAWKQRAAEQQQAAQA